MAEAKSALFSPMSLVGGLELPNRVVVAPMCQFSALDGCATEWHLVHYGQFALGGAGLVIVEATAVTADGRISPQCLGLYTDAQGAALAQVVQVFRRHGLGRIGIQIGHAGRKGSVAPPWGGGKPVGADSGGWTTVSASAIPFDDGAPVPQELDAAGLMRIRDAFVLAARRAVEAGFDLIELHMAHGYLLHQFLSPLSNRRTDAWGGSLDGRMRFPLEVFAAVRDAVPSSVPVGVRISATDFVGADGWTLDSSVTFSSRLNEAGAAFIHVSGGGLVPTADIPVAPGYMVGFARRIREDCGAPTIAVGLITRAEEAEAVVRDGSADLVALGRTMLANPRWPQQAALALGAEPALSRQYRFAIGPGWRDAATVTWAEAKG
jgi:2,4-dienoyl-CoA reductase-like NADH-dependent reductase (Old Yellow Enzyme family)